MDLYIPHKYCRASYCDQNTGLLCPSDDNRGGCKTSQDMYLSKVMETLPKTQYFSIFFPI